MINEEQLRKNKIEKSTLERVIELFKALLLLKDCVNLLNDGKEYHLATLYGQLRGILTDKTQKSRNKKNPLLIDLAEELNVDLSFYANALFVKKHDILEQLRSQTVLQYADLELSLNKLKTVHEKTNLKDFLDMEILIERGISHTFRYIINTLSDKYGGSHYDPKTDEKIIGLKSIELNSKPLVDHYLIDLSMIVLALGIKIPKQVSDLSIQFGFKLFCEASDVSYLFDIMYNRFRISVKTIGKKVIIDLRDLVGYQLSLEKNEVLQINKYYLLTIVHELKSDYISIVNVYLNDDLILTTETTPLLLTKNTQDWEFVGNTSVSKTKQNFGFDNCFCHVSGAVINKDQHLKVLKLTNTIKPIRINPSEYFDCIKGLKYSFNVN